MLRACVWLDDPACCDLSLTSGKAANLSRPQIKPGRASRQVADKRRMTVAMPGATNEVDVPRFRREQPVLEEGQLVEAAHLALDLEQAMGCPVDLECCWREGQLYLLQCRPIATLK